MSDCENESYTKLKNKIIMKNAKYSINANLVYKNGYSGKNVNIAVLDTGVFKHKQLDGCIKHFMDFVGGKETCYDDNGHGTHVCGILSAADIGMAPGAGLYVFKVLDYLGMGQTSDSIRALKYIKENCVRLNIRILNFSVGISRKIITVGSFDDIRSGKGPTDCCIVKPEILAPGHDIISLGTRDGTYVRKTGTSMATPIVSGAIALLLEKNPNMRPEAVKLALYNTCDRAGDSHKGSWGIINVDKLVGIL